MPGFERAQQLLPRLVLLQAGVDAQHGEACAQCFQPFSQRSFPVLFQQHRGLAQARQRLMQRRFVLGKRDEFFQPGHHALFAQQLFQSIHHRLAFTRRHIGKNVRRLEQVEQVMVVKIALQRGQPALQHRAHRQRVEGPAGLVRDQHLHALQQGTHAPRGDAVLHDDGDVALACV